MTDLIKIVCEHEDNYSMTFRRDMFLSLVKGSCTEGDSVRYLVTLTLLNEEDKYYFPFLGNYKARDAFYDEIVRLLEAKEPVANDNT